MTDFCSQLVSNITRITRVYSDKRCFVLNRGLGSIINAILIPTMITQQMIPMFSCPNFLERNGCSLHELLNHSSAASASVQTTYVPPENIVVTTRQASAVLRRCKDKRNLILTAAARQLFSAFVFHRQGERIGTAVHIRNGDKLDHESKTWVNKTDNVTWMVDFLNHSIVGKNRAVKVYSDECGIAEPVALAFNGSHSCLQKGGYNLRTSVSTCDQSKRFVGDMLEMSTAENFIGSTRSNIPRLVYKLRRFRNAKHLPGQHWTDF